MSKKVAVITGSGRGIGKAIAERLADEGYYVAIVDIDEVTAQSVARHINERKAQHAKYYVLDVSSRVSVFNLVDHVVDDFGRLDVFVNNAGIAYIDSIVDSEPEKVERLFDVNLKGTFGVFRLLLSNLKSKEMVGESLMRPLWQR
ncbi:hypothetical protein GCM10025879_10700 [Leuconostoc litchii]|nr:hypothetical protein GCM10025879_10700 [Leuconostoc litchii]